MKKINFLIIRLFGLVVLITLIVPQAINAQSVSPLEIKVGEYIDFLNRQTDPQEFYSDGISQQIVPILIENHVEFEIAPGVHAQDILYGLTSDQMEDYDQYCSDASTSPLMMLLFGRKPETKTNEAQRSSQGHQDDLGSDRDQSSLYSRGTLGPGLQEGRVSIPGTSCPVMQQQAPRGFAYKAYQVFSQLASPIFRTQGLSKGPLDPNRDIADTAREVMQEWAKMKPFIVSLVNRDRDPAIIDSYYRKSDDLYILAEAGWIKFSETSRRQAVELEVAKQFAELLAQEKERLATRQQSLGEMLLEKYKERSDFISQIINPNLVSGNALENDISKLINGSLLGDHEIALNKLIALPDISFSGALGASYSLLKLALRKHAEVYQDSLQESLQNIDQHAELLGQETQDHLESATTATTDAPEQEEHLNCKHAPLTLSFAGKIKTPPENNDQSWFVWAHDITSLCNMNETEIARWSSYVVGIGRSKHDALSSMVKEAWKQRIKNTSDLLTKLINFKAEELSVLNQHLEKKEDDERTLKETNDAHKTKLDEAVRVRITLEGDRDREVQILKQMEENQGTPGQRLASAGSLKAQQEKVASIFANLQQAQDAEATSQQIYQEISLKYLVARHVSWSIARARSSRSEDYDRKIKRLQYCIQADQGAWKTVWTEDYLQDLIANADAALEEARGLCAAVGRNWSQHAERIATCFERAAELANIVMMSCTPAEKAKWEKRANQASSNAIAARDPHVAPIKVASEEAKDACNNFWSKAQQFIQDRTSENLAAAEASGKEALPFIKEASQLAQNDKLQLSFNQLHRAIEGATTFILEDMFSFLGAGISGNITRANQVLAGVEKSSEALARIENCNSEIMQTIWASDIAWISDAIKRHLDFVNAHYNRASQNSLWSWLHEHGWV